MGQFDNEHPLGSVNDAAVTDPSAQATAIAALKGLLSGGGSSLGVISTVNSSTTPLSGSGGATPTFTGAAESSLSFEGLTVMVLANQAGTLFVDQSSDGTNWDVVDSYSVLASTVFTTPVNFRASQFRVRFTNGSVTAQATFRLQTTKWPNINSLPRSHGQKAMAQSVSVALASDQVSAAAALSDTLTNPTTILIGACQAVWDGAQWLRAKASSIVAGALLVDLATRLDNTNDSVAALAGTRNIDFSFTSPASASTVAQTAITGLGPYRTMSLYAILTGATGGTLDIYLQFSPDGGTTWVDYYHFTQIIAGASAIQRVVAFSKQSQALTPLAVGSGTSPALAAGSGGDDWGDRLRIIAVAGTLTSAGAAQTLLAVLSS